MRLGSTFLGMLLVLLQMLNPFLHAHAQGLSGSSGLDVHIVQGGYVADMHTDAASCKTAEVVHWVLGMPTAHRSGERLWVASDNALVASTDSLFFPVEGSRFGGLKRPWNLPPDWQLNDSFPPPALAPPTI